MIARRSGGVGGIVLGGSVRGGYAKMGAVVSLIYVLGGTSAVSDDVVAQLKSQVTSNVVRINGRDRFVVAEKVADLHDTTNGATVAYGLDWPDALAGSALGSSCSRSTTS